MPSLGIVALLVALLAAPAGATPPSSPGGSDAARACQDGGYTRYVGPDGRPLRSPGECAQFVARGGRLRPPLAPSTLAFPAGGGRGRLLALPAGYTSGREIRFRIVGDIGTTAPAGPFCPGTTGRTSYSTVDLAGCNRATGGYTLYTPATIPETGQPIEECNPDCPD